MHPDWPHSKLSDPRQSGSSYLIFFNIRTRIHSRSTKPNYGRLIYRKGLGHASQLYYQALPSLETWIRMESPLITRGAATTYPTSSESIPRQPGLCIVINIPASLIQGGQCRGIARQQFAQFIHRRGLRSSSTAPVGTPDNDPEFSPSPAYCYF